MNKLILAEDKVIKDGEYEIIWDKKLNIDCRGNLKLCNYSKEDHTINISLTDNSEVNFDKVSIINKDLTLTFNLNNNSHLEFNYLIINEGNNTVTININMLENNNKAKIKIRCINKNKDNSLNVICNGYVNKSSKDNELTEDLKGLILNADLIKISPNIYVDTNEVLANHLVTIGSFNPEELFYLTSNGLSIPSAKKLLLESFTTNFITEEFKERILLEVKNIE